MAIEEKASIKQAYSEGNEIESSPKENHNWYPAIMPIWDFENNNYRIKQQPKQPITLLECIKDQTDLGRYSSEWLTQEQYDSARPGVYIKVLRTITI